MVKYIYNLVLFLNNIKGYFDHTFFLQKRLDSFKIIFIFVLNYYTFLFRKTLLGFIF